METAPPGFYDDGSGQQRWWDGSDWTDQRIATPPARGSRGSLIAGYILGLIMPIIGFGYGLILLAVGNKYAGEVMGVSVFGFVFQVLIGMVLIAT